IIAGTVASTSASSVSPFVAGARGHGFGKGPDELVWIHGFAFERAIHSIELGELEHVIDHLEKRLRAGLATVVAYSR
ncbi:MAG: hypothetical protein HC814_03725, partial [Rhodobacteraceae bacterium]|nr:hypothetical protein [Paracoccaceae bacterium]